MSKSLPLLDDGLRISRESRDIADRMLCLQCVVAVAFDVSRREIVSSWAFRVGLESAFTAAERTFLSG